MIATPNMRRKVPAFDPVTVQGNIARALTETKKQLGCSLKDIEAHSGLDDSTVCKVLDASRGVQLRYVEDIVHAFNKLGARGVTPESVILQYNTPEDIAKLPSKLGFDRFLDRHRQVPMAATVQETAAVRQLVKGGKKMNGGKFTKVEIEETITRVYNVEPMTTMKFTRDEQYAVKIGGEFKVLTFPFVVDGAAEFEVIGRVVGSEIK